MRDDNNISMPYPHTEMIIKNETNSPIIPFDNKD